MVDWQSIGYSGPPITGDPGSVATLVGDLAAVADTIDDQLATLAGIDAEAIWDSASAAGFREASAELPDLLTQVSTRYRGASDALDAYVDALGTAVTDMDYWGSQAEDARVTLDTAQRNLDDQRTYEQDAQDEVDRWNAEQPESPTVAPPSRLGEFEAAVAEAQDAYDAALGRIEDAVAAKDDAGDTAAEALAEVNDDGLENDRGWFSGIAEWVSRALDLPAWADLLRFVASVVSIAALLLCWVPVLGPLLGATALVLNVLLLLVDLTLVASGEGSWTNVAFDVFGIATGGFGRALSAGGRAAQHGYRALNGVRLAPGVRQVFSTSYPAASRSFSAFATHARNPVANFSEVAEHIRIVRTGRGLPLSLGGHNPGYWNAFRANAATHGRNLVGLGGPGAAGYVWADVGRRSFLPSLDPVNPVAAWDNLSANHQLDRAADHAGTIDPVAPQDTAPSYSPPPEARPDLPQPDLPRPERPDVDLPDADCDTRVR